MYKAGIRLVSPILLLLLSVSNAHASYSFSEVTSVLQELSASAVSPEGARLQVLQIGSTVRGRPIWMAVLSAAPVEAPQTDPEEEAPADTAPAAEAPVPGADAPENDAGEIPSTAPAAAGEAKGDAPCDGRSIVLTLDPIGPQAVPLLEAPRPDEDEDADTLALQSPGRTQRVLIICRQHGNEPAGTEAAMRFLREYASTDDPSKMALLRRTTFLVIPMLNVDGAEKYERRNARNVDLNRDWVSQSQPETRTVVRTVRAWRPDLVMDLHELATSDWTPSFVEAMEPEAGASEAVGDACNAAIAAVVGPLRAQSVRINARPVLNYREPRLAHRYFAIKQAVPTILVETRRAGSVPLEDRAAVHYAAIVATARYMAGEELGTPSRVIEAWLEPGASRDYRSAQARRGSGDRTAAALAARRQTQLASRGGSAASVAKKRAALAKKLAAQRKKKHRR